ncbi:hypothetical protein VPH35_001722 [Triticum aestivum]
MDGRPSPTGACSCFEQGNVEDDAQLLRESRRPPLVSTPARSGYPSAGAVVSAPSRCHLATLSATSSLSTRARTHASLLKARRSHELPCLAVASAGHDCHCGAPSLRQMLFMFEHQVFLHCPVHLWLLPAAPSPPCCCPPESLLSRWVLVWQERHTKNRTRTVKHLLREFFQVPRYDDPRTRQVPLPSSTTSQDQVSL